MRLKVLEQFIPPGKFKNKHTGINGDIGCISFNGNKIATTGGEEELY